MRRTNFFPSLVLVGYASFGLPLALPLVFHVKVLTIFCDNHRGFRIWFRDKIELAINNFFTHTNLGHNKNNMELLHAFCAL
jgi:hypothetical protein